MLAVRVADLDVPQTIFALAGLATAIGIPAWLTTRRSRRAEESARATAETMTPIRLPLANGDRLADVILETLRDHGELIRATRRDVSVMSGQLLVLSESVDTFGEEAAADRGELRGHLEAIPDATSLAAWVREQMSKEASR